MNLAGCAGADSGLKGLALAARVRPHPFHVSADDLGRVSVVRVQGEVDAATAPRMGEAVNRLLDAGAARRAGPPHVDFMDLHGLAVMIRATRRARADGGSFARRPPGALRPPAGGAGPRRERGAHPSGRHRPAARRLSALPSATCARSPTPGRSAATGSPTASCSRRSPASATGSCGCRRSATAPGSWCPRWSRASGSYGDARTAPRVPAHPPGRAPGVDPAVRPRRRGDARGGGDRGRGGRRPDRPQHGLPGAEGLQDRRRRRAARRPRQGGGDRARRRARAAGCR